MSTYWASLGASSNPSVPSRTLAQRRLAFLLANILQPAHLAFFVSRLTLSYTEIPWIILIFLLLYWRADSLQVIVRLDGPSVLLWKRYKPEAVLWGAVAAYVALLAWWALVGSMGMVVGWGAVDICVFEIARASVQERNKVEECDDAV